MATFLTEVPPAEGWAQRLQKQIYSVIYQVDQELSLPLRLFFKGSGENARLLSSEGVRPNFARSPRQVDAERKPKRSASVPAGLKAPSDGRGPCAPVESPGRPLLHGDTGGMSTIDTII